MNFLSSIVSCGESVVPGKMRWILCLLFFFVENEVLVIGLRIEEVFVPETGLYGGSVTLRCNYDLESDQLLSVKWYKDDHEFFSYSPQRKPPTQFFKVEGFGMQKNNSRMNEIEITLTNLTLQAGGNYKCEVLAERPSYRSLSRDGNLTIIVPPDPESPRINNISSTVLMGDTISGNCTSFRSYPPATLMFEINGHKVENPKVIEYRPIEGTWEKSGQSLTLYTSIIGLKFQVGNQHFRQGIIKLRCTAKIGKMTKKLITELDIRHKNFPDQFQGLGQRRNAGIKPEVEKLLDFLFFLCLFLFNL